MTQKNKPGVDKSELAKVQGKASACAQEGRRESLTHLLVSYGWNKGVLNRGPSER